MSVINLSADDWAKLTATEQNEVTQNLIDTGLLEEGSTIVGDTTIESSAGGVCEAGCATAASLAHAVCNNTLSGIKQTVCNVAVSAAEALCKSRCS